MGGTGSKQPPAFWGHLGWGHREITPQDAMPERNAAARRFFFFFAGENADEGGNHIWQTIPLLFLFYFCLMVGV